MKLNQCVRCGSFFTTEDAVCPNCKNQDKADMDSVKKYIANTQMPISVEAMAYDTSVSVKNINRYLQSEDFSDIKISLDSRTITQNDNNKKIKL